MATKTKTITESKKPKPRRSIKPKAPAVQTPTDTPAAADAVLSVRAAIARTRAAADRGDFGEIDLRDSALEFRFDQWKNELVTINTLRASANAGSMEVQNALLWSEHRRDMEAITIMATAPETEAGWDMRAAVVIATVLPVLQAHSPDTWEPLHSAIGILNARAAELMK